MGRRKLGLVQMPIRLRPEVRARLRHHGRRTGATMSTLIRDAVGRYLEELDTNEAHALEAKRARTRPRPFKAYPDPKPLGMKSKRAAKPLAPIPPVPGPVTQLAAIERLRPRFPRWMEYLEAAADSGDAERRGDTVREDIKAETASSAEYAAVFAAFHQYVSQRR